MRSDVATIKPTVEDREAIFLAFVRSHREISRAFVWQLLAGDRGIAEDVVQEAFVRAYHSLHQLRDEAALPFWFRRILIRQVRRHQRSAWWRREHPTPDIEIETGVQPSGAADPLFRERLRKAIEALSRGQREAFVLVTLQEHTVAEAAELLGRSPGTIKTHLFRARARLREALGEEMRNEQ